MTPFVDKFSRKENIFNIKIRYLISFSFYLLLDKNSTVQLNPIFPRKLLLQTVENDLSNLRSYKI